VDGMQSCVVLSIVHGVKQMFEPFLKRRAAAERLDASRNYAAEGESGEFTHARSHSLRSYIAKRHTFMSVHVRHSV